MNFREYLKGEIPERPIFQSDKLNPDAIDGVHYLLVSFGYVLMHFVCYHSGNNEFVNFWPKDTSPKRGVDNLVIFYYVNPSSKTFLTLIYSEFWLHFLGTMSFSISMDIMYPYSFWQDSQKFRRMDIGCSGHYGCGNSKIMLSISDKIELINSNLMKLLDSGVYLSKNPISLFSTKIIIRLPNIAPDKENETASEIYRILCGKDEFLLNFKIPILYTRP